jgi:hypothetical protein
MFFPGPTMCPQTRYRYHPMPLLYTAVGHTNKVEPGLTYARPEGIAAGHAMNSFLYTINFPPPSAMASPRSIRKFQL